VLLLARVQPYQRLPGSGSTQFAESASGYTNSGAKK
jgi:hypothetical protein